VIALNTRTQEVLAVGQDAWQMIGRTPGYIVAVRPLRQGAITDFDITERMIRLLLHRCGVSRLNRPRVLICVPSAITSVERRAVKEAAHRAGASAAYLIEQPMAAAIGAGLLIHEPIGNMVVDAAGSTSTRPSRPSCDASTGWRSGSARQKRSSWPSGRLRPTKAR
jgi:rod shape-determining protein MreB